MYFSTAQMIYILVSTGFISLYLGMLFSVPFVAYIAGPVFFLALQLSIRISINIFAFIFGLSIILYTLSPSPYFLAALFPLLGLLFSGQLISHKYKDTTRSNFVLIFYLFYILYYLFGGESSAASYNHLSVIVIYAILFEYLLHGKPSKWYIPLILSSFLVFGNRSSVFLLLIFVESKLFIAIFMSAVYVAFSILYQYDNFINDIISEQFTDQDFFFKRGYTEERGMYAEDFLENFTLNNLTNRNWNFSIIPKAADGFYDVHNSMLTVIVRDAYLGILKVFMWSFQVFTMPLGMFLGISMRSMHDSFLLGNVMDIFTYSIIGRQFNGLIKKVSLTKGRVFN